MMGRTSLFSVVAVATRLVYASPAQASGPADAAVAEMLFQQGVALMNAGHAIEACPKFEESQKLDPATGTLMALAQCYETRGSLASAWPVYLEAAASAHRANDFDREKAARARAQALTPRFPKLVVSVAGGANGIVGLRVTRDNTPIGAAQRGTALPVDLGPHTLRATAPGCVPWQTRLDVTTEGSLIEVQIPALVCGGQPKSARPIRAWGLGIGGVGIAAIVVGSIFGLESISKHGEATKYCNGAHCWDDRGRSAGDAAIRAGNVSTITMIAGTAFLAAGVTLWVSAPKRSAQTGDVRIGVVAGVRSAGVLGAF